VSVDMASYKAEFLAHHYRHRLRPRAAYAMGGIRRWAALAAHFPIFANALTHTEPFASAAKALAGIAPQRTIPRFAETTFTAQFRQRKKAPTAQRPRVLLWPDTFTNFFSPQIGLAAADVLEAAGFAVELPAQTLCCGRPLYDFGLLDAAKRHWRRILFALREEIRAGTPIVALEPSCVSAFRDELVNLFAFDEDAQRLSGQVHTLAEFLVANDWRPPPLRRKALVHAHCHHKAVIGLDAERALFERMQLDCTLPDDGCCGLAGSFGFERGKYEVSMQIGERVLLPAVRSAADDTLIVTDGFSCREQIAHGTQRAALHLAEVLAQALVSNANSVKEK
jgi:Fe-S oxidoreductase